MAEWSKFRQVGGASKAPMGAWWRYAPKQEELLVPMGVWSRYWLPPGLFKVPTDEWYLSAR
ncbi:MAG: hypothetical protein ACKO1O_08380, partial [Erythrobacter sp.]